MVKKTEQKKRGEEMIFDYSKLKGRIVEKNTTQEKLAKANNMTKTSLNLKLNNKIAFNQEDIIGLSKSLEISKEEIGIYFFTQRVQKTQQ